MRQPPFRADEGERGVRSAFSAVPTGFLRDQRGNFAILFSLSAVVLLILAGIGIDYLDGLSFKSRWDSAADSAALGAVQSAKAYAAANAANQSASAVSSGAIAAGIAQGTKLFNANAGVSEATATVTPTVNVTASGAAFTATVSYVGKTQSHFGGLVGVSNIGVSGSATATSAMTTYINYYIIVDNSESMGVGSSTTDMANLYARTMSYGNATDGEPGCVLGCHVTTRNNNGTRQIYSNEDLAHNMGSYITLRIDAAKTAIANIIAQAKNAAGGAGNIQIGLYALSSGTTSSAPTAAPYINTISSPTSDFASLSTLAGAIDLATPDANSGWGDTDIADALNDFNNNILSSAPSGSGFSASAPLNYVFIITDGVQDVYGPTCFWDHCTQALDPTLCAQLKRKATVGVIYTTYLPFYQNNNPANGYDSLYGGIIQPIASQIAPNLQSCATSSSFYYEAPDGPSLTAAMAALFTSTSQTLRLTQ